MRVLTWLPRDLREQLAELDPAREREPVPVPPPSEILGLAEEHDADPVRWVEPRPRRSTRTHGLVASSCVAAAVAVIAVGALVVGQRGTATHTASGGDVPGSHTSAGESDIPVPTSAEAEAVARRWATFPVTAEPRPVVLLSPAIQGPASGFADQDTKTAYIEGRFRLAAPLPAAPATRDGYAITSADDAVHELLAVSNQESVPTSTTLQITRVQLTDHRFPTDRGEQLLPAWAIRLAGVHDDVHVLAVAPSQRWPAGNVRALDGGRPATLSPDGRHLTIRFVARHASTGPCDRGFTSTLHMAQTATAVVLDVTSRDLGAPPLPSTGPNGSPYACAAILQEETGPIQPGAPDTRTITLDRPLGGRVVLEGDGYLYEVTSH